MKPQGRIREKIGVGGILTGVFVVALLLFVALVIDNRPPQIDAAPPGYDIEVVRG